MKDCFAYDKGKCKALKRKRCKGCNFFKSKKQAALGRQKAIDRIMSLDKEKRDSIIQKYYGINREV